MEIAREIILEIIQNDPGYEKAWIWLVETVADKAGKIDILKTRLEEYPNSPLARKAMEHLAPEMLNHLQTEKDAVYIPPSARQSQPLTEKKQAIEHDINSRDVGDDRFGFDDSDLIEFEEPKKESGELFTGEGLFGDNQDDSSEFSRLLEEEEEEDADEVLEQDLEAFLRGGFAADDSPQAKAGEKADSDEMTFTNWLQGEGEEEETPVDELAFLMAQHAQPTDETEADSTSASNPFVLSRDESMALFGEDVVNEPKETKDDTGTALRTMKTSDSQSAFRQEDIAAMEADQDFFAELDMLPNETSVNADDLLELENGLRKEVVGNRPRPQSPSPGQDPNKSRKKKKNSRNQAFIWGCSVLAAIIVISLLGLAYLFILSPKDTPSEPTPTATMAPSATPTEAYTLVAPWLAEKTPTPTPEGE
jgi:hypothetical protein